MNARKNINGLGARFFAKVVDRFCLYVLCFNDLRAGYKYYLASSHAFQFSDIFSFYGKNVPERCINTKEKEIVLNYYGKDIAVVRSDDTKS
ncbi:MAG: hypothetical protein LBL74_04080 [Bacteroidales bacterium]|jgi:hypothetical protein|nr:hypothetical protein [Bacteroidales bacterium]